MLLVPNRRLQAAAPVDGPLLFRQVREAHGVLPAPTLGCELAHG